jgi:hypothetical protein
MKRIMYIKSQLGGLDGPRRIGWVEFSNARRSYRSAGRLQNLFRRLRGVRLPK